MPPDSTRLIRKFDKQADFYERRRRQLADRKWREPLLRDAFGDVLEVAVGAGANFPYYPQGVRVTAIDFSGAMLEKAKQSAAEYAVNAEFHQADIESVDFPDDNFDTIVSTLSFCGYERPGRMLESFNRWCRPGGHILMMEHGLSRSRLVSAVQHAADPLFRSIVGCHMNRDIPALLEASPLRIVRLERRMLGAVYLVRAEPGK